MSTRGRGRGRSTGTKKQSELPQSDSESEVNQEAPSVTLPVVKLPKQPRNQPKSTESLLRNMDIARSKVGVIIDSLEGDDNELSLKRNVVTAVKHLKEIHSLLDH